MGFVERVEEFRGRHMGVDLRGDNALVAEQLLHAADVSPVVKQMGGETVPQGMRTCFSGEASRCKVFFQQPRNAPHGEPSSEPVAK